MSVPVPLDELAEALARRANAAYLITVGDDGRAHCVAATLEWTDDELVVPAGATSVRNAAARGIVVLLTPPSTGRLAASRPGSGDGSGDGDGDGDGATRNAYSLIVDADVTATKAATTSGSSVRLRPTHAVLHRPAVGSDGNPGHDCVHVYDEAPGAS
ncbi:MAG TPA: hypothetical protein VND62_04250 [Acidimicrobiales bacterium]|nr:hypothetical protein [Acidimicrobiales bacterium]